MSRLRDGIHRRALLTARVSSAKCGASRLGWTPGQDDFEDLTREIKGNPTLVGMGPRYVWTERYKSEAPFGGIVQYENTGTTAFVLATLDTHETVTTVSIKIGTESTDVFQPVDVVGIQIGTESDDSEILAGTEGMDIGKIGPDPFGVPNLAR